MKSRTDLRVGDQKRDATDQAMNVITYEHARSGNLYISSNDKVDGTYANSLYQNTNKLLRRDTSQLGIKHISFDYCLPNVNARNNNFKFMVQDSVLVFDITMDSKNYETPQEFYDALIIKMNAEILAGGSLAFMSVVINGCESILSSTVAYKFIKSNGIDFGDALHGIFYSDYTLTMKTISNMQYTRYIDILITELKSAEMGSTTFTKIHNYPSIDHIYRLFINQTTTVPRFINKEVYNIDYITYRHRTLTSFQITLFDEYQQVLYSETQNIGSGNYEVPYVKYNMTINLIS